MSLLHPLDLSKSILDPIHGLIRLTKEEVSVINHPLYQRLRKIKQNGLLHLIFPSSTHTRFEHSIGVLFVADSMLRALVFNSIASSGGGAKNKVVPWQEAQTNQAFDFSRLSAEEATNIFRITRLAALVHDLGHGPLSHTFDKFAPPRTEVLKMLNQESLKSIEDFNDIFNNYDKSSDRVPHEVMSCIFFADIWHSISDNKSIPRAVAAAILGKESFEILGESEKKWVPLVHDLIASAPADADRMDYLERDSRSCGVSYGLFDRNRLLKSMLCYKGSNDSYRLGIKLSGYRSVENFIQARFELFVQVYYHKTNRAIEMMLEDIVKSPSTLSVVGSDSFENLKKDYIRLSDEYFMDVLRGEVPSSIQIEANITDLASNIHDRKLWKRVFDLQDYGLHETEKVDVVRTKLEEKFSAKFCVDAVKPKATKDLSQGAAILVPSMGDQIYTVDSDKKWEDISPIIKTLGDSEKTVTRIFSKSTPNTDDLKSYRVAARDFWQT